MKMLIGSIPASIGDFVWLKHLYLNENELTGSIPASIGDLVRLQHLYLYDNALTGSIPTSIGDLVNLKHLLLWDNALTGSIPASIGDLVNLEHVYVCGNDWTDSIPECSCGDSPLDLKLFKKLRTCDWVKENVTTRCEKKGVKSHCPLTCNTPEFCFLDSTKKFKLAENDEVRSCKWVGGIKKKCRKSGVKETCRESCSMWF